MEARIAFYWLQYPPQPKGIMATALTPEAAAIEIHKIRQFDRLGFTLDDALMAVDQGIDWHDVERLLTCGCAPELALAILAPLP